MARCWTACALGLLLAATPAAGQSRIFREISIAPHGTVSLGEAFEPGEGMGAELGEGLVRLPPGLGDAEGILVVLAPDGRVSGLVLRYALLRAVTSEFNDVVRGYEELLGEPVYRSWPREGNGDEPERCIYWEDSRTRLELLRTRVDGTRMAFAGIFEAGPSLSVGSCEAAERIGQLESGV